MKFEWDEHKNQINIQKHGIDFNKAKDVFNDKYRIEDQDMRNDYGEDRFLTIGKTNHLLTVVHTPRQETTRIISARVSNKKEKDLYFNLQKYMVD